MKLSYFVCGVRIVRVQLQFLLKLRHRIDQVFGMMSMAFPLAQTASDTVMDPAMFRIESQDMAVSGNGLIERSLALIGLGCCLLPPDGIRRNRYQLLRSEKSEITEDA